jgi:hypothetical protein
MPLRILVGGLWMVGLSTMICALVGRWYHVTPMWLFLGFCGMGLLIGCGLGQMVLHKAPVSQYENFGRGLLMLLLLLGTLIATSVRLRAGFHRQLALAQFLFGGGLIATLVWNVYPRLRSGDPMKAWPNTFGMTMEIDIPALIILGGGVSLAVLLAVIHGMGIARHDRSLSRISQVAMVIGLFGTVGYLYVRVSAAAGGTADVVLPLINGLLLLLPTLAIYTVGLTRSWHEVLAQDPAIYIAKKTARH